MYLFRTLSHLMSHLHDLSKLSSFTGMTSRNLAIVWAPNILRSLHQDFFSVESLRDIGDQAKVVECFIDNYQELFAEDTITPVVENHAMVDHEGINYSSSLKSQMFRSMQSRNLSRKSLENSMTKCSSLPRLGKRYLKKVKLW